MNQYKFLLVLALLILQCQSRSRIISTKNVPSYRSSGRSVWWYGHRWNPAYIHSKHQQSHFYPQIVNQYKVITDASGTPVQLISTITFYASISIYNLPAYSQIMKFSLKKVDSSEDEYLIQTESSELFIYSSSLSKSIFYCDRPIKLFCTLNLNETTCKGYDSRFILYPTYSFEDHATIHLRLNEDDCLVVNDFRYPRYRYQNYIVHMINRSMKSKSFYAVLICICAFLSLLISPLLTYITYLFNSHRTDRCFIA